MPAMLYSIPKRVFLQLSKIAHGWLLRPLSWKTCSVVILVKLLFIPPQPLHHSLCPLRTQIEISWGSTPAAQRDLEGHVARR